MADDDDSGMPEEAPQREEETRDTILARLETKSEQVNLLLSQLQVREALSAALADSPTLTRDEACKTANWVIVQRVLLCIRDIEGALEGLPPQSCDVPV
eukprot:jgi/Mesen1/2219/ME000152S01300